MTQSGGNVLSGAFGKVGSSMGKMGNTFMAGTTSQTGTLVLTTLAGVLCIYVVYFLYKLLKKTDLKTVQLLEEPRKIKSFSLDHLNKDVTMPTLYNGTEFSYSFWMYINEFEVSQVPKLVFYQGKENTLEGATPIFYMDPDYVSLNVLVKTDIDVVDDAIRDGTLSKLHEHKRCDYARMKVPYVPLNRWVNVSLVVDNKHAQLFFDGELRKVLDITQKELIENKDVRDPPSTSCQSDDPCNCSDNVCCDKRIFSVPSNKKIFAGVLPSSTAVNGYLSQLRFFNYAITLDHAKVLYKTGPLHQSILSNIGIPMYGVRNPFYKIGETEDDSDDA